MVKLPEMRPREPWGPHKLPNVVRDEFRRWYGDDYQDFIDRASPEKLEILVIDALRSASRREASKRKGSKVTKQGPPTITEEQAWHLRVVSALASLGGSATLQDTADKARLTVKTTRKHLKLAERVIPELHGPAPRTQNQPWVLDKGEEA